MDWDKLRIFKHVAEAGSFTHAGDTLKLSQSAISRQISALETSLGVPLFHRHARGLVLTEQGEMLFHTANDVFERLHRVEGQLSDSKEVAAGPLTVTTVAFIASTLIMPQMNDFKDLYPNIQLTMLLDNRIYDLSRREADIAIRLYRTEYSDLIEKYMGKIDFCVCASKDYLTKKGRPQSKKDLADHTIIGFPPDARTPFKDPNWALRELGVDVKNNTNVMLLNSMHTRHTAVRNGIALSVLPRYLVERDSNLEILFPDLKIPSVEVFFVYPQERRNSERISVFRDFMFKNIKLPD